MSILENGGAKALGLTAIFILYIYIYIYIEDMALEGIKMQSRHYHQGLHLYIL